MQVTELDHPLKGPDDARLSEFFNQAYGEMYGEYATFKCSIYWRWLYRPGAISLVIENDGRIIAHVGCIPFVARRYGRSVPGTWSVDTYVLSEHRGKGYGTRLQMAAQATRPMFSSFWLSNANSRIKVSMGQTIATTVRVLTLSSDTRSQRSPVEVTAPDPCATAAAAAQYLRTWDFYVERSLEYCAWRFVDQPRAEYRQIRSGAGLALIRRCGPWRKNEGMVGDAFAEDNSCEAVAELLELASGELFRQGCRTVRFACCDAGLADLLGRRSWSTREVMQLHAPGGTIGGRVFLSFSDQDADQFPY